VLQSRLRKHEEMAVKVAAAFIFMLFLLSTTACQAKLSSAFYHKSCPKAESAIRTAIRTAIARERRMAASLIRLHFHDCFVQVLLQLAAIVLL
jgi:peroxidase